MSLYEYITANVHGRIALNAEDAGWLAEKVAQAGDQDVCEIGTLYGGSAVLAALVKRENQLQGKVYTVDPLTGYYGKDDPTIGGRPSRADVEINLEAFGVADTVVIVQAKSVPWPFPHLRRFGLVFVDGDHSAEVVRRDLINARLASDVVLFHDYKNPGVRATVDREAASLVGWGLRQLTPGMALLWRLAE